MKLLLNQKSLKTLASNIFTVASILSTFYPNSTFSANYYYMGSTNGAWTTVGNWSTNSNSSGAPTVAPGAADDLFFNMLTTNSVPNQFPSLSSANRAANSITFGNSGTNYIVRSSTTNSAANTLTVTAGITNLSSAGPSQISRTDQKVSLKFGDVTNNFVIANNSSSSLTFFGQTAGLTTTGTNSRTVMVVGTGSGLVNFDGGLENGSTNTGVALSLRVTNVGAVQLGASSYSGGTILDAGTIALASGSALGTGSLTINGGAIGSVTSARTITNNIIVGGNFGLGVTNAGLAGQSTTFNGNMDLGNATRTVSLLANTTIFGGDISNGGLTIESADATRQLRVTNAVTYAGPTTVRGGVLVLSNTGALSLNNAVNLSGVTTNATFDISGLSGSGTVLGSLSGSANTTVALGAKALTVGGDNSDRTFSGVISGAGGSLIKNGSGVMNLSASNSYTGSTTVNNGSLQLLSGGNIRSSSGTTVGSTGTLLVNQGGSVGSVTSSGNLTVNGSAGDVTTTGNMNGSGTVGSLTMQSGSLLNPGNSPGILTVTNGINFGAGSTLVWELIGNTVSGRGTNYDGINLTGGNFSIDANAGLNLVFNSTSSTVNWNDDTFWGVDQTWTIILNSGSGSGAVNFSAISVGLDSIGNTLASQRANASFSTSVDAGNLILSYQAVPEPSTPALLVAGLVTLLGLRTCRRKSV